MATHGVYGINGVNGVGLRGAAKAGKNRSGAGVDRESGPCCQAPSKTVGRRSGDVSRDVSLAMGPGAVGAFASRPGHPRVSASLARDAACRQRLPQ